MTNGGRVNAEEQAAYLVLLGNVLLVVLLHLPKLGLQTPKLDLHLLHVLQVSLGALVQDLDGLGHVLDLGFHWYTLAKTIVTLWFWECEL